MTELQQLMKEMEALKAENAALKIKKIKPLTTKVSQKGAVSVYGLGRFPVTLYKGQWERLIEFAPNISKFIEDNESQLTVKE